VELTGTTSVSGSPPPGVVESTTVFSPAQAMRDTSTVSGTAAAAGGLLERDRELAEIRAMLADAARGRGSILVISGEAGIGKTRLLGEARRIAAEVGLEVADGRGGQVERELPWGLVRQLLDPILAELDDVARERLFGGAATPAGSVFGSIERNGTPQPAAVIYGLYWVLVALAADRPVALLVDDAHWADDESLRLLAFLATRIQGLRAAFVVAVRSADPDANRATLLELLASPEVANLHLGPLSRHASERVIAEILGGPFGDALVEACHRATHGNPFLLSELVRQLAVDGIDPAAGEIPDLEQLRAPTIVRSILLRLARLSGDAVGFARAVAVLGDGCAASAAAALAELDPDAAARAHGELTRARILVDGSQPEFVHPLVRSTLYEELPAAERSRWHGRAARALAKMGAAPSDVVPYLLEAEPGSDPWARETLRSAASTAMDRGAPRLAARLLDRARREAVDPRPSPRLLLELGQAEFAAAGREGLAALREALAAADDERTVADTALELGRALHALGSHPQAAEVYEHATGRLEDSSELHDLLRAHFIYTGLQDGTNRRRAIAALGEAMAEPRASGPAADIIDAVGAFAMVASGAPGSAEAAERALADGWLLEQRSPAVAFAAIALTCNDHLDRAAAIWERALADGRSTGERPWASFAACFRAQVALRAGDLAVAETAARESVEAADLWDLTPPDPASFLCQALLERGHPDEAELVLESSGYDRELPSRQGYNQLLFARARLHTACGRHAEAIADLRELGARLERASISNPAVFPWRSALARLLATKAPDEAAELANGELGSARAFGASRAIGIALIGCAFAARGSEQVGLLEEAAGVLAGSPAELDRAQAVVELGAALRRTGHERDARKVLRDGVAAAQRLGATTIAERGREELITAGARPRRDALRGRDALTAAETRVARLAAEGRTNPEIAQELFVVLRTVETHLTSVYRKLEISSRAELTEALARS
jgi:DNA-binding CsgD family transcriptional regulator/tetratricopeptide (TPR) repeat protein